MIINDLSRVSSLNAIIASVGGRCWKRTRYYFNVTLEDLGLEASTGRTVAGTISNGYARELTDTKIWFCAITRTLNLQTARSKTDKHIQQYVDALKSKISLELRNYYIADANHPKGAREIVELWDESYTDEQYIEMAKDLEFPIEVKYGQK